MSSRKAQPRRNWLAWEVEFLRQCYADHETHHLAVVLGRPADRVLAKAHALGLHKSTELLSQVARARSTLAGHGGIATRFAPGHTPANKGKKMPGFAPGRMAQSQFKPGHRPHTWVPVGSFRVVEGILERKYSDDPGPPNARWRAYSRLVWEAAHGPVPAGHVVAFRPGCRTTDPQAITLDVLELATKAEIALRNSIHRMPPELADVARLRGRLTRAINEQAEQAGKESA